MLFIWKGLVGNLAAVALMMSIWVHLQHRLGRSTRFNRQIGFGLTMALAAVASMVLSVELHPGYYIDLRYALLAIAAGYGGPLAAIVSLASTVAFRVFLGGGGLMGGLTLIFGTTAFGLAFHFTFARRFGKNDYLGLLSLASIVGGWMISVIAVISLLRSQSPFAITSIPFIGLNMITTAILGWAFLRLKRLSWERDIMLAALTQAPDFFFIKDTSSRFLATNQRVAEHNGFKSPRDMIGLSDFDLSPKAHAERLFGIEQGIVDTGAPVYEDEESLGDGESGPRIYSTSRVALKDSHGAVIGIAGVTRDVTEQKRLEREVLEKRNILSHATTEMSDGLAMFDRDGYLVFCNEQYRSTFPLSAYARVPGAHITDIIRAVARNAERADVPTDVSEEWIADAARTLHENKHQQLLLADGRWISLRTRLANDGSAMALTTDITQTKESEISLRVFADQMKELAQTDALTGVMNRRAFDEAIQAAVRKAKDDASPLTVLMLDVDRFKTYNDTYGHQKGDDCLKAIAQCLQQTAQRPTDIVARYGGEEFCIVLPNTAANEALLLTERFRTALRQMNIAHSASEFGVVTTSIGMATSCPEASFNAFALIKQADQALYRAKANGRDSVCRAAEDKSEAPRLRVVF